MINAFDGLRDISASLAACGIEGADKEAQLIFTECSGIDMVALYRDSHAVSDAQLSEMRGMVERRSRKEPFQYIVGHVDFCGFEIMVGPGVLIPRPETELVAEETVKAVTSRKSQVAGEKHPERHCHSSLNILDLCTGSGCIAIVLAKRFPDCRVFGTDISGKALEYARKNASANNIENVAFLMGDVYKGVKGMKFDIIVSNPPYIRTSDIAGLQSEVRDWEPVDALNGGKDGMHFYREILQNAADYLAGNGSIVLEVGDGEAVDAVKIAEGCGLRLISVVRDFNGIDRVLHFSRSEP